MIRKTTKGYALKAKGTGRTLGTHRTRAGAVRQERAIQAAKHTRKGR